MCELNRSKMKNIMSDVEEVLKSVADKHGVQIQVNGANFESTNGTIKLTVNTISGDGNIQTKAASDFIHYAEEFGISAELLGKEIQIDGESWKVVGLKPRSRKTPVLIEKKANGRVYKCPVAFLNRSL